MKIKYHSDRNDFTPSEKLKKLISYVENKIGEEFILEFNDNMNSQLYSAAYSESDEGEIKLRIATKLIRDKDNLEQSIAHELGHAILSKVNNYPSVNFTTGISKKKEGEITLVINSIEDIIVNLRLSEFSFPTHGISYYTSIKSETELLAKGEDPYFDIDPDIKDSFIFTRIIMALGYLNYLEENEEKRDSLRIYLETMSDKFPELFNQAENSLLLNEPGSIFTKNGFKKAIKRSLQARDLYQNVTIEA